MELISMPLVNGAALTLFDLLFEKKPLNEALLDAGLLAGSTLGTDLLSNLVVDRFVDTVGN